MLSRFTILAGVSALVLAAPLAAQATVNVVQSSVRGTAPVTADAKIADGKSYLDYRKQLSQAGGANPATAADAKGGGQVVVDQSRLASKLLGASVKDSSGKTVGTVDDVVIDYDGTVEKILIKDSGFFGSAGKVVAVDYKAIDSSESGTLFKPVDKAILKTAVQYDKTSVRGVLDLSNVKGAVLKSPSDETVGQIDDIAIDHGKADQLIVKFDQSSLLGGTRAVMNLSDANVVNKGANGTFVQLNQHQADTLKLLKKGK